jgi:hypothetical protein
VWFVLQSVGQQLPTADTPGATATAAAAAAATKDHPLYLQPSVAITNSFGMPSMDRQFLLADIPKAAAALAPGQVSPAAGPPLSIHHSPLVYGRTAPVVPTCAGLAEARSGPVNLLSTTQRSSCAAGICSVFRSAVHKKKRGVLVIPSFIH